MPDLLLAARNYPPNAGGTAHLLYELFRHFPPESVVSVCGATYFQEATGEALPFPTQQVLVAKSRYLTPRIAARAPAAYRALVRRRIRSAARSEGVHRIVAHYPDANFVVASYQVAQDLKLPLAVYFDILWEERGDNVELARLHEHSIVTNADLRYAITPFAAEYLAAKHGVPFDVVPHVMEPPDRPPAEDAGQPQQPVVHFAGGVYPRMNQDAIERLARVITTEGNATFEIFGAELDATLPEELLAHEAIRTGFVPRSQMDGIQRRSSVLYLPQAFESSLPTMIRCNFPTKALEYMRAGRPILLHSPADSYLTSVAREYDFAVVVDEPDDQALGEGLQILLEDEDLRKRVVKGGLRFLAERDSRTWSSRIHKQLIT